MAGAGGIGGKVGRFLGFDPTPGFNLSNPFSGGSFISRTGSNTPLGMGLVKGVTRPPTRTRRVAGGGGGGGGRSGGSQNATTANRPNTNRPNTNRRTYNTGPRAPSWVDPTGRGLSQSQYNDLRQGFDRQKKNIFGTAQDAAGRGARNLKGSILDFIDMYETGQGKVDEAGVQNELAKRQGQSNIMGMVGRGIRSGGVTLANKNASDSSAAGAIARAYGDIGGREMRNVGNQYQQGEREIEDQQKALQLQATGYERDYEEEKVNMVDNITAQARDSLAQLDAAMTDASLPERIAIEQEKSKIKSQALQKLSQFDQLLQKRRRGVQPMSDEARRRQAAERETEGYDLGEGAFDFTDEIGMGRRGGGPFASDLPVFARPSRDEEEEFRG